METLLITAADIKLVLDHVGIDVFMDNAIEALESAFMTFDSRRTEVKQRSGFLFHGTQPGVLEWMPVHRHGSGVTIKTVGYNPGNPDAYGVPTIISTISFYDDKTGHLIAVADGNLLTAVRTGAASAIASRILAREDSDTVGLVGCGCQAVTQLHALSRVFKLRKVYLYDQDPEAAASFRQRAHFLDLDMEVVPRHVLEAESDIICTATSVAPGAGPVLADDCLKRGVHVNSIGADLPGKIELPLRLLKRSLVCPDFLDQALVEGECQQLQPADIGPSIIELVQHRERYRSFRERETVFDSTGFALEDEVAMRLLLGHVYELQLGRRIELEHLPANPKDPYDFDMPALPLSRDAYAS